ncbi:uncharacterized protein RJT20DRAFT_55911 [Scheffersomyces xylosifermentans]|uniref:uncharacterized protein n=1 Tax=Scheffersomyces xylosifermentans TaxID=1304137 RepID=UPI00315CFCC6
MSSQHKNPSLTSLNDNNYYDIAITTRKKPGSFSKNNYSAASLHSNPGLAGNGSAPSTTGRVKKFTPTGPKRVASMSALTTLDQASKIASNNPSSNIGHITKRPGDYYLQKLSTSSLNLMTSNPKTPHLPPAPLLPSGNNSTISSNIDNLSHSDPMRRPISGESLASLHSNFSDEGSSIVSSQFDVPIESNSTQAAAILADSRFSSLTSHSIATSEAPSLHNYHMPSSATHSTRQNMRDSNQYHSHEHHYDNSTGPNDTNYVNDVNNYEAEEEEEDSPDNTYDANYMDKQSLVRQRVASTVEQGPGGVFSRPNYKASSTTNVSASKSISRTPSKALLIGSASKSTVSSNNIASSSSPSLSRSKTRYISSKESKQRQLLRKKKYDENDDDDEILSNELDHLVFNVPVIKNHSELYSMHSRSHGNLLAGHHNTSTGSKSSISSQSSAMLSRSDLMVDNDNNKYNINGTVVHTNTPTTITSSHNSSPIIKPCPLPGRLGSQTDLSEPPSPPRRNSQLSKDLTVDSIVEEDDADETEDSIVFTGNFSTNDDIEITQNISDFYNQRSTSISKLAKISREQTMLYKLPNFVKSQSSMEDLHLISLEKLTLIDQTRPINLPPKSGLDKSKHNKEFQKVLSSYELNTKNLNDARVRSSQIHAQNQQQWIKIISSLIEESTTKSFNKRFLNEKANIRKLAWESNVPSSFRYQFFMKILTHNNNSQDSVNTINNSFDLFDGKYKNLSESIKNNKDAEFNGIIDMVLNRPLFDAIIKESAASSTFNLEKLKHNFKYLLYIKSLSEYGLHKHDQIFLVPILLVLFQNSQSIREIYCLLELINQQIFNREFLSEVNSGLENWNDLKNLYKSAHSSSSFLHKVLDRFNSLEEFDNLNSNSFFDILLQFNDKMPLSLSAPSTPIMSHPGHFSFTHSPSSSSNISCASNISDNAESAITPRTSMSTTDDIFVDINSSALQLIIKFLQLIIIFSNSIKSKNKNNAKVISTFLVTTFQYYHIGWNSYSELLKSNKPIKLNKSADQVVNLDTFVDKWKDAFGKF